MRTLFSFLIILLLDHSIGITRRLWDATLGTVIEMHPVLAEFTAYSALSAVILRLDIIAPIFFYGGIMALIHLLPKRLSPDNNLATALLASQQLYKNEIERQKGIS